MENHWCFRYEGQDIANKVLPGLGYFAAALVALEGSPSTSVMLVGRPLVLMFFWLDVKIGALQVVQLYRYILI